MKKMSTSALGYLKVDQTNDQCLLMKMQAMSSHIESLDALVVSLWPRSADDDNEERKAAFDQWLPLKGALVCARTFLLEEFPRIEKRMQQRACEIADAQT